jgi:hypothetical protein
VTNDAALAAAVVGGVTAALAKDVLEEKLNAGALVVLEKRDQGQGHEDWRNIGAPADLILSPGLVLVECGEWLEVGIVEAEHEALKVATLAVLEALLAEVWK